MEAVGYIPRNPPCPFARCLVSIINYSGRNELRKWMEVVYLYPSQQLHSHNDGPSINSTNTTHGHRSRWRCMAVSTECRIARRGGDDGRRRCRVLCTGRSGEYEDVVCRWGVLSTRQDACTDSDTEDTLLDTLSYSCVRMILTVFQPIIWKEIQSLII